MSMQSLGQRLIRVLALYCTRVALVVYISQVRHLANTVQRLGFNGLSARHM